MRALFIWSLAAACAGGGAAHAQSALPQVYGTVGYAQDHDLGVVQGRIGARFSRFLGVEGEFGVGVEPDAISPPPLDRKLALKRQIAGYAVAYAPLSPTFDLTARLGYGATRFKTSFTDPSGEFVAVGRTVNSWNYGVGAQYVFQGKNAVRLDYLRQDFSHGRDGNVVSIAYVRQF